MKYPGAFLLNEYGTNKELAKIYGVSERTIYRWKNKAQKETGAKPKKATRPRLSTLQKFKGTRKELAKKYNVSERTAYRWLAGAREKGVDIPLRTKKPKYIGAEILLDDGTNKQLADKYGVSERTISRWKRRARAEVEELEPFEVLPPEPETETATDEDFFTENFTDEETYDKTSTVQESLKEINKIIIDNGLINKDSLFKDLGTQTQLRYLQEYFEFQKEYNPWRFYEVFGDKDIHYEDPEGMAMVNIWGDEFEMWLTNQIEIDNE